MKPLSIVATVIFTVYVISGFLAVIRNKKRFVNLLFFLVTMSLAVWSFTAIIIYAETDKDHMLFWYRISSFGFSSFYALCLHFVLALLNKKIRNYYLLLLYLPAAILIYLTFTGVTIFKDFIYVHGQWVFVPAFDRAAFYLYVAYYVSYITICIVLLYRRAASSPSNREKHQMRIIIITFIVSILIGTGDFLLPNFTAYPLPALAPLSLVIFVTGTWIAMIRYNFLELSPSLVADRILENIRDCVLVLDTSLKIIAANKRIGNVVRCGPGQLKGRHAGDVIVIDEPLRRLLDGIAAGNESANHAGIGRKIYCANDPDHIPYDADISAIRDEFNDVIGVLIIAGETKGLKDFIKDNRITRKQMDIINLTVAGLTNVQIGRQLGITKRTVETHLNNIYNRLNIGNKIELYKLLIKYNINTPPN